MNFDWIKTRSDFDDDKPAVIDHAKQTSWTYQQLNARAEYGTLFNISRR